MAGIYLHIPFCRKACVYCDFHFSVNLKGKKIMLESMISELALRRSFLVDEEVETIYFGGGTPSVLSAEEISSILKQIKINYSLSTNAEITLEANPDDLSEQYLQELYNSGINRLSIGWQSFIPDELSWMNRAHSPHQNIYCVEVAKSIGFKNITVDLIYGSKFQNLKTWADALKHVVQLDIEHLSCYNLTVEDRTVLGHRVKLKEEPLTDEDLSTEQFDFLMAWAESNNYDHYEISNFAKKDSYSRHNSAYWLGKKYLGIGPSAHSYDCEKRTFNVSNNSLYVKNLNNGTAFYQEEVLTRKMQFNEYVLTGLRTKWGINLEYLTENFSDFIVPAINKLEFELNMEQIKIDGNQITLTSKGKHFADHIAQKLFVI
ncbi:MAG: radical SAM family heme chaperone HemW [Bacteroidota bacterium]